MSHDVAELASIIQQAIKHRLIEGKDYFTTEEAAHYCCVSTSKFYEIRKSMGVAPFNFHGKMLYRKADLRRVLEDEALRQRLR